MNNIIAKGETIPKTGSTAHFIEFNMKGSAYMNQSYED